MLFICMIYSENTIVYSLRLPRFEEHITTGLCVNRQRLVRSARRLGNARISIRLMLPTASLEHIH